jgi:hypothetical protein
VSAMLAAMRACLRYAPVLLVVCAIACAPAIGCALLEGKAANAAAARSQLQLVWIVVGLAFAGQLLAVGAAAPLVRGLADGAPLALRRAPRAALAGLAATVGPWLVAIAAIGIGLVALVVPGVILLALFATVGATARAGGSVGLALATTAAETRARPGRAIAIAAAVIVVDVALAIAVRTLVTHAIPAKPTAADFAAVHGGLQLLAAAIVVVTPIAACALASARSTGGR